MATIKMTQEQIITVKEAQNHVLTCVVEYSKASNCLEQAENRLEQAENHLEQAEKSLRGIIENIALELRCQGQWNFDADEYHFTTLRSE